MLLSDTIISSPTLEPKSSIRVIAFLVVSGVHELPPFTELYESPFVLESYMIL